MILENVPVVVGRWRWTDLYVQQWGNRLWRRGSILQRVSVVSGVVEVGRSYLFPRFQLNLVVVDHFESSLREFCERYIRKSNKNILKSVKLNKNMRLMEKLNDNTAHVNATLQNILVTFKSGFSLESIKLNKLKHILGKFKDLLMVRETFAIKIRFKEIKESFLFTFNIIASFIRVVQVLHSSNDIFSNIQGKPLQRNFYKKFKQFFWANNMLINLETSP